MKTTTRPDKGRRTVLGGTTPDTPQVIHGVTTTDENGPTKGQRAPAACGVTVTVRPYRIVPPGAALCEHCRTALGWAAADE